MAAEDYVCDLCGCRERKTLAGIRGRSLVECAACGLVSFHPIPTAKELESIYNDPAYFVMPYFADEQDLKTEHYANFERTADLALREFGKDARILETGPGDGCFMSLCQSRGMRVDALEFSGRAAEKLKGKFPSSQIFTGTMESAGIPNGSHDMVAGFDVIEHCVSPMAWLRACRAALKKGGILSVSTMDTDNFLETLGFMFHKAGLKKPLEKLHPPYHLYYFTRPTLARCLSSSGFEILETRAANYDVRKATSSRLERAVLRGIYMVHDLTGKRTNQYIIARKVD